MIWGGTRRQLRRQLERREVELRALLQEGGIVDQLAGPGAHSLAQQRLAVMRRQRQDLWPPPPPPMPRRVPPRAC